MTTIRVYTNCIQSDRGGYRGTGETCTIHSMEGVSESMRAQMLLLDAVSEGGSRGIIIPNAKIHRLPGVGSRVTTTTDSGAYITYYLDREFKVDADKEN